MSSIHITLLFYENTGHFIGSIFAWSVYIIIII